MSEKDKANVTNEEETMKKETIENNFEEKTDNNKPKENKEDDKAKTEKEEEKEIDINSEEADVEKEKLDEDMHLSNSDISPILDSAIKKIKERSPNEPKDNEYADNVDKYSNSWRFGFWGKIAGGIKGFVLAVASFIGSTVRAIIFGNSQAYNLEKDLNNKKMKDNVKNQINNKNKNEKNNEKKERGNTTKEHTAEFKIKEESQNFLKKFNFNIVNDDNGISLYSLDQKYPFKLSVKDLNNLAPNSINKYIVEKTLDTNEYEKFSLKDIDLFKLKKGIEATYIVAGVKLENGLSYGKNQKRQTLSSLTIKTADISSTIKFERELINNKENTANINIKYNNQTVLTISDKKFSSMSIADIEKAVNDAYTSIYSKSFCLNLGKHSLTFNVEENNRIHLKVDQKKDLGSFEIKSERDVEKIAEELKKSGINKCNINQKKVSLSTVSYVVSSLANPSMVSSMDPTTRKYFDPLSMKEKEPGTSYIYMDKSDKGIDYTVNRPNNNGGFDSEKIAYVNSISELNEKSISYILNNLEKTTQEMMTSTEKNDVSVRTYNQDIETEEINSSQEIIDKVVENMIDEESSINSQIQNDEQLNDTLKEETNNKIDLDEIFKDPEIQDFIFGDNCINAEVIMDTEEKNNSDITDEEEIELE